MEHPPIQPADLKGRPLGKEEIEERLRGLVQVKPHKGLYIVVATCEECGARIELSQLIRLSRERRRGVRVW